MFTKSKTREMGFSEAQVIKSICRESLYDYVKEAWKYVESFPFVDNWHIGAICEHLQAVTTGQIPKLLINLPPGCSKSLLCSVFWPTWEWSKDASIKWFFASYDQRLSTRDSMKCRNLINTEWYQPLWGGLFKLNLDQNQKIYYESTKGGYRMATSVGGHGTGEHPARIVIDDPHNVKEAESDIERQNVIEWWKGTMSTRGVAIDARRVIIMQRLHWEDLSNYVMEHEEGWEKLILPMRFEKGRMVATSLGWNDPRTEEGELLTPKLFDEVKVRALEKTLGPYGTAGQLQQSPSPKEGGMFKIHYFNRRVKAAPMDSRRVRMWDLASTDSAGCNTAGVLMCKDNVGRFYIEHCVADQWEPYQRNDTMKAIALRDRAKYGPNNEPVIWVEKEGGASAKDAFQGIVRHLAGFPVRQHAVNRLGDKEARADPLSTMMAAENVWLVDDGSWDVNSFCEEFVHFPFSKFKDRVDATSGAFALLVNAKQSGTLFIYNSKVKKKEGLRIIVLSREQLGNYVIDETSILINITDYPPFYQELRPNNALVRLQDYVQLQFSDIQPVDYQEVWEKLVEPYNQTPDKLIMNREQGRKLWSTLLKKRQQKIEVFVIQDEGDRRGISVAKAISDTLRLDRKDTIYYATHPDSNNQGDPENKHVYSMTKTCRSLVM